MTTVAKLKTVSGVDLAKISLTVLQVSYKKVFGRPSAEDVGDIVAELADHFRKTTKGEEILECEDCGGGSPPSLFPDHCPFCGSEEDPDEEAPAPVEAAPPPPTSSAKTAKSKKNGVAGPAKSAPLVVVPSEPSSPNTTLTAADLDKAVLRLRASCAAGAIAVWTVATELRDIHERGLWKLRNGVDGKPLYKSFAKFLAAEVDMHERTAYRLVEIAKEFSEADAKKYGVAVLKSVVTAPKESRAGLLEAVESGEVRGTRGVAAEVRKLKGRKRAKEKAAKPDAKKRGSAKAAKAAADKAAEKAAAKKKVVTVAVPAGRTSVPLLARPMKKADPEKPAKEIADRPWGKLECVNGSTLFFAVVENGNGELELTVEARRE